jgi:glycosyltransferase involved in cell wall biosynthesis
MRILHISTFERSGGAAIAASRLHLGLRALGHDSTLLVRDRTANDPVDATVRLPDACGSRSDATLDAVLYATYTRSLRTGVDRLFSTGLPTRDVASLPLVQEADVVNVHWASGLLSAAAARALQDLGKPLVWTLHDQALFTGGCHYSGACEEFIRSCGSCRYLADDASHVPALLLRHKQWWLDTARLTVVCPSDWLSRRARASALLRGVRVETIPNGLPVDVYQRASRGDARRALSLPQDATVLLLGSDRLDEERKGHRHAAGVLGRLTADPELGPRIKEGSLVCAAFGEGHLPEDDVPILMLGRLTGDAQMALAYRAADLFLLPALEDNLPNTMLESIAAGTPVVAFATGGIGDMLDRGRCGVGVATGDADGLAGAVASLLKDRHARECLGRHGAAFARAELDQSTQAGAYLGAYEAARSTGASRPGRSCRVQDAGRDLRESETALLHDILTRPALSSRLFAELTDQLASHQALIADRGGEILALRADLDDTRQKWCATREALGQFDESLQGRRGRPQQVVAEHAALKTRLRRVMTQVVIYGAGGDGRRVWEAIAQRGTADVAGFVDDDPRRHGRSLLGLSIHPPLWLASGPWDVIALAVRDAHGAEARLARRGIGGHRVMAFPVERDDATLARVAARMFPDPLSATLAGRTVRGGLRLGIFGSGSAGLKVWEALADVDQVDVAWFADNDSRRQNQSLLWLPVIAPADMGSHPVDAVVIGSMSRDAILAQLLSLGVKPDRILTPDVTAPVDTVRDHLAGAIGRLSAGAVPR